MADERGIRSWAGVLGALGAVWVLAVAGVVLADGSGAAVGFGVAAIDVAALAGVLLTARRHALDVATALAGVATALWYLATTAAQGPTAVQAAQGAAWLTAALIAAVVAIVFRTVWLGVGACGVALAVVAVREPAWAGLAVGTGVVIGLLALRQVLVQRESRELATTDSVTGLVNRAGVYEALRKAVARRQTTGVLVVDLNGFKHINDAHGVAAGDRLLAAFGAVMHDSVLGGDVAGRIGGDEFAVVLHDIGVADNAVAVAKRIAAATGEPVNAGGVPLHVSASIGVAVGGPGECTADELLHRADLAMQEAKRRAGGSQWACWDPSLSTEDELSLEQELRTAVPGGQLRLVYQPIVALPGGEMTGVEALVRWQHPRHGLLLPESFVPLAERIGVVAELGRWVLEQACEQVRTWQGRAPGLHLSVNISARQLEDAGFAGEVQRILQRTGFFAGHLILEVAESAVFREADAVAVGQLDALSNAGIRIALDDFGTGYSSLHYLTRLPVDVLKLDSGFVAELDGTSKGSAVAQAVVRLGQMLHLDTVAEGVENEAQARELTLFGCSKAQGRYFSAPVPADTLELQLPAVT